MSIIKDKKIKQITIDGTVIPLYNLDHTVRFVVNDEDYQIVGVKDGNAVSKPVLYRWKDANDNIISFPYTPTDNITLYKVAGILPEGYQEVEYLQSTGTQYINTGIIGRYDTSANAKFSANGTSDNDILGVWNGTHRVYLIADVNNSLKLGYGVIYDINKTISMDTIYEYTASVTNSLQEATIDGVKTYTGTISSSINTNMPMYLFLRNYNGEPRINGPGFKIYFCKIYQDSQLVRNFIPCYRISDSVAGMYDLANSGKNLCYYALKDKMLSQSDGITVSDNSGVAVSNYIDTSVNKTFILSNGTGSVRIFKYGNGNSFLEATTVNTIGEPLYLESNVKAIRIQYNYTASGIGTENLQVEAGTTPTAYEPHPFYVNRGSNLFAVGPDVN